MTERFLHEKADPGPASSAANRGSSSSMGRGNGGVLVPTGTPSASIARQLVRALRSRLAEVSTAGRPGGETMVAITVVLAEAEMGPLAFIERQQRAEQTRAARRDAAPAGVMPKHDALVDDDDPLPLRKGGW